MNRRIKYSLLILLAIIVGYIFYYKVYIPKSTYSFVKAEKGDLKVTVFGIGEVAAKEMYPVTSQTGGKITALFKEEGDFVKKGELIAKIDPVDLPEILAQAEAAAKKASLEVEALKKELKSLKAKEKFVKITYERYLKLKNNGFAAKAEYDKAKSDFDSIKASLESLKIKILSAKEEEKRALKNVEAVKEKISRLEIKSPVNGYVISKNAQIAQSVTPYSPIITIADPKTVWIKAYIDERISGNLKVNDEASITLRSKPDKRLKGFIKRIEPKSDPITQERVIDVSFKKIPIPFYIGEQAEVEILTNVIKNRIIVPLKVLVKKDGKYGVWIYKDGKAHFKEVKIFAKNGNYAAVENIEEGATILIPNRKKKPLFNGASVRL